MGSWGKALPGTGPAPSVPDPWTYHLCTHGGDARARFRQGCDWCRAQGLSATQKYWELVMCVWGADVVVSGLLAAFGSNQECRVRVVHDGFGEGEGVLGKASDGVVGAVFLEGRRGWMSCDLLRKGIF